MNCVFAMIGCLGLPQTLHGLYVLKYVVVPSAARRYSEGLQKFEYYISYSFLLEFEHDISRLSFLRTCLGPCQKELLLASKVLGICHSIFLRTC